MQPRRSRFGARSWAARSVVAALLFGIWYPSFAFAHPTPGSVAYLDFTVDGARLEQSTPVEELERSMHLPIAGSGESAAAMVQRSAGALRAYAAQHLRATTTDGGAPWGIDVVDVTGVVADDGPRALYHVVLRAPKGEASRSVNLHDDIVAHEVVSHYTTVYVRSDWAAGGALAEPRLAGVVHAGRFDVTVARTGSFWRGLRGVVSLGMEHIATGSDHLMFLFALALVAPLTATRARWSGRKSTRETLFALARVVSAFTIGHSLTLALGAFGLVALPSAAIEVAIAVSILVTALHAARPIFPRREALVAGAFGLVHGLAFASTLAGRDLGRAQAAWTLLGFNTGIEIAQLGLLAVVVPWLLLLARTRAYDAFRAVGAGVAGALAAGWLLERTTPYGNPTARPLAWMEAHPLVLLVGLAGLAVGSRLLDRAPARAV